MVTSDEGKRDARGAGAAKNPSKKPVRAVKFRFRETGALTYVSHLDINRAVMRGLVKSKLPLYYTEGFNPIPKLTFASPLSVGCGGENELARFKIIEEVDDGFMLERLRASMPDGIEVLEVYSSDSNFKEIAWAENVIDFVCAVPESAETELARQFEGPVTVLKKTKSSVKEVDISPYFKDISFERTENGMRIKVFTCADNTNYLNPEYIAKVALRVLDEGENGYHTIMRKQFYKKNGEVFR